jgi:hypothetical protein
MRLFPFAAIAGEPGTRDESKDPAQAAEFEELVASWKERLDELVREVHEHFRPARRQNVPRGRPTRGGLGVRDRGEAGRIAALLRRSAATSRAPFGSGKKYKRCCGAGGG